MSYFVFPLLLPSLPRVLPRHSICILHFLLHFRTPPSPNLTHSLLIFLFLLLVRVVSKRPASGADSILRRPGSPTPLHAPAKMRARARAPSARFPFWEEWPHLPSFFYPVPPPFFASFICPNSLLTTHPAPASICASPPSIWSTCFFRRLPSLSFPSFPLLSPLLALHVFPFRSSCSIHSIVFPSLALQLRPVYSTILIPSFPSVLIFFSVQRLTPSS
ncbi:hypothetical protein B0H19DRAFT_604545 [Mycena capillaripes]|nr:hypothetical protein B0H19DRAFT_604545 [Mycena capillaripes]